MEELMNFLRQFGTLGHSDADYIAHHVQEISLARGDYLLEVDEVPQSLCFVRQGVMRTGCNQATGGEVTKRFIVEQHFVMDAYTFSRRIPSREFVQAVVDTRMMTLSTSALGRLSALIPGWEDIMTAMTVRMFVERGKANNWRETDAASRYLAFEQCHPGLADRVGLSLVASYLGISISTLSRIRRSPQGRRNA